MSNRPRPIEHLLATGDNTIISVYERVQNNQTVYEVVKTPKGPPGLKHVGLLAQDKMEVRPLCGKIPSIYHRAEGVISVSFFDPPYRNQACELNYMKYDYELPPKAVIQEMLDKTPVCPECEEKRVLLDIADTDL